MSIKTFLFAVLCICMSTAAHAQSVEFRGGGVLEFKTNACKAEGWPGAGSSEPVNVRFRPAGVGSNGNETRLSVIFPYGAMSFRVPGKLNNTLKTTQSINVFSKAFENNPKSRARATKITPANINANTQTVRLQVQFRLFDGINNCNVNLDAPLYKRR